MLHLSAECIGVIFDESVFVVNFRYGMLHSSRLFFYKSVFVMSFVIPRPVEQGKEERTLQLLQRR